MKTTVDISDALLLEAKDLAKREGTTVRSLIESGLREVLEARSGRRERFVLRDASFAGSGLQEGVEEGAWERVREMIYEGRGG